MSRSSNAAKAQRKHRNIIAAVLETKPEDWNGFLQDPDGNLLIGTVKKEDIKFPEVSTKRITMIDVCSLCKKEYEHQV